LNIKSGKSLKVLQDFSENFAYSGDKVKQVRSLEGLGTTGEPDGQNLSSCCIEHIPDHFLVKTDWPQKCIRLGPSSYKKIEVGRKTPETETELPGTEVTSPRKHGSVIIGYRCKTRGGSLEAKL